ncbi:hypothetical protein EVAR_24808_1 [Eumeta japonica]|uniref:Uncharacterized protein n=1 Tax=Eumeta variegata TaxID=151549 RepID=A0A4C1W1F7_EUMVA|nr:hypothetical protein EVAR_24808_1 [Eumeta japonica]
MYRENRTLDYWRHTDCYSPDYFTANMMISNITWVVNSSPVYLNNKFINLSVVKAKEDRRAEWKETNESSPHEQMADSASKSHSSGPVRTGPIIGFIRQNSLQEEVMALDPPLLEYTQTNKAHFAQNFATLNFQANDLM